MLNNDGSFGWQVEFVTPIQWLAMLPPILESLSPEQRETC